jgi:hypothetical protein
MNILKASFKETILSVTPVIVIVLFLSLFIVEVSGVMFWSFILGVLLIISGLTIFLYGIETGMEPVGQNFGNLVAESNSQWMIAIISFIIGFSVTVAEPDLLILGQQIEIATNGSLASTLVVFSVAIGVGVMIALGVSRLLHNFSFSKFFLIIYIAILLLGIVSSDTTIAMAFDASGATTGALTTPFVLVLSASIAARKGGSETEENSFGLVGAMSTGPIIAVFLLVLLTQSPLEATEETYLYSENIFTHILAALFPTLLEAFIALFPIFLLFIVLNITTFKLEKPELLGIFKGFIATLVGLALFLIGVNEGFMDMGHYLGSVIASYGTGWLIFIGVILGLVVVLAEPAVQVLGDQVREVSHGEIKKPLLLAALSIGVGIAVGLTMIRISFPEFQVWYVILPGFALALALSFLAPPIFTGIAFDAGGVASGPMAVTFILAFTQGAASYIPGADTLEAFGVIAFIALTPIITIQVLGVLYNFQSAE